VQIDVLTLFPEMFSSPFGIGLFQRAVSRGLVKLGLHNIRDYAHDKHRTVDDYPYGGGSGMVLKPEPIFEAVATVKSALPPEERQALPVILLTPQGRLFSQQLAEELSQHPRLLLICGRYEGVDERVRQHLATDEISIGDYVLGGGELAAMVIIDAVVRLLPGVLGSEESSLDDSHAAGLLGHPQYTRPPVYQGWPVPEVLLSGDHARIARWRREQALARTREGRPELLERAPLNPEDRRFVEKLRQQHTQGVH
jgi:tRNA (guanine37-N1)-methyltransferase